MNISIQFNNVFYLLSAHNSIADYYGGDFEMAHNQLFTLFFLV